MSDRNNLRFAAFDLDGTLIDSATSIVKGVLACWRACEFPDPDPETVRRIIGLPFDESILALMPEAGETEFDKIRNYHDEVRRGVRQRPPMSESAFPGALDVLTRLEGEEYLLGVVTSRSNRRLRELLDSHGFGGRFVTLKTADMGPGKPNPHLLLEAMDDLGVDRANTVMIGDTTFDIQMAVNAGTSCVGVSWGVHEVEELRAAGADHIVEEFAELPPIVDALTRG